jgi:hypothetical protein
MDGVVEVMLVVRRVVMVDTRFVCHQTNRRLRGLGRFVHRVGVYIPNFSDMEDITEDVGPRRI